jgi:hypothetical protein
MTDPMDRLDALLVAAKHHRLLLENESVRVLETRVEPGDTVPVHTHRWQGVSYVLSWSPFVRRDEVGNVMLDTRLESLSVPIGTATWQLSLGPHSLENVGDKLLHVITVELKGT